VTGAAGLLEPLDCMMGHAAAFGDADGDGWPDLLFGTFSDRPPAEYRCPDGARPDRLLHNRRGAFAPVSAPAVERFGRASGALFADLDGDGDLDLVVSHNSKSRTGSERATLSNLIFRNDNGAFTDVTEGSGLSLPGMAARNVVPLDYDGDGRLDLFLVGDMFGEVGSRLLRGLGGLRFADRTAAAGLPLDLKGLGAAAADVNNDGRPDLFVSHADRLYMNAGGGTFRHMPALDPVFAWRTAGNEDWRAGVAFGDVDRDGWLDLVVGHHYGSAFRSPVPVRLYMNRSTAAGLVDFQDVTAEAQLPPIGAKSPHVEIQDLDNDGWPDIYVSVHVEQEGGVRPLVLQNARQAGPVPRFQTAPFTVASGGVRDVGYGPAGPTVDFDGDGRLDVFLVEWWPTRDSILYRNTSQAGNFLEVLVRPGGGAVPQGFGARVEVFAAGRLGQEAARIGRTEIMSGYGYSSGQEAVARLGLGDRTRVDLRVVLPHGGPTLDRPGVQANQRLVIR
jgi:hypothetical protein